MPEQDPYQDWLEEFKKEVDSAVGKPQAASAAARSANEAFETWWKAEQEPLLSGAPRRFEEGPAAPAGGELGADLASRLQKLAEEKAALEHDLSRLARENAELKERQAKFQGTVADFEARMSRAREGYESHIARLESQARLVEEQTRSLRGDKQFLEGAHTRLEARNKTLEEEVRAGLERGAAAEKALLDLKRRAADMEAELARLRVENAAQAGSLEELRKQSSIYQEQLILSKELTDSDVSMLRQELNEFLTKVKRLKEG